MISPTQRIYKQLFSRLCVRLGLEEKDEEKKRDIQMIEQHIFVKMTSQRQSSKSPKQPSSGVKSTALKQHPNIETQQERFAMI